MNTTSFGGHLIYHTDSELTNVKENLIFESYDVNKKNDIQIKLSDIGIYEFEQLYSISETKVKDGLREYLAITKKEYAKLIDYSKDIIGDDGLLRLNQSYVLNKGLGARKPEDQMLNESVSIDKVKPIIKDAQSDILQTITRAESEIEQSLKSVVNYSNSICQFHDIFPIKNQGNRGTCVAFSLTSTNEYYQLKSKNKRYNLSEQHLYYEAKQIDGDNVCGTTIANAISVITSSGQCLEKFWVYRPTTECNDHGVR